jgi:hypothetical protein
MTTGQKQDNMHAAWRAPTANWSPRLTSRAVGGTTLSGTRAQRCRTPPCAQTGPGPLLGSEGVWAITQHPRHGDQARSPLVPVLAPLRVTPPVRPPHPHRHD